MPVVTWAKMLDGRWRKAVDRRTGPIGALLQRHGVTADVLTATGLLSAMATAYTVATGHLYIAIPLLTLTGLHDLFDGPVAKAAGTASLRGAFFDSVVDRVSDAVVMGGVTWYLVSTRRGHEALLPLAILGVTSLVSYQRAKAEALGIQGAKGGLMERAERMILLGVGFLSPVMLVPDLWVLLGLTTSTALGRFVRVWRLAEGPARPASARSRWYERRADSTWAARREARGTRVRTPGPGEPWGRLRSRWHEGVLIDRVGSTRRARQETSSGPKGPGEPLS
ncbi:MAG: CDP-alcohol phosphatidyltransferase family protein [Acidimicrobiales bacterium]